MEKGKAEVVVYVEKNKGESEKEAREEGTEEGERGVGRERER